MEDGKLQNIRDSWKIGEGTTHFDGCEKSHYVCAIAFLLEEVERLRSVAARERAEAAQLRLALNNLVTYAEETEYFNDNSDPGPAGALRAAREALVNKSG